MSRNLLGVLEILSVARGNDVLIQFGRSRLIVANVRFEVDLGRQLARRVIQLRLDTGRIFNDLVPGILGPLLHCLGETPGFLQSQYRLLIGPELTWVVLFEVGNTFSTLAQMSLEKEVVNCGA